MRSIVLSAITLATISSVTLPTTSTAQESTAGHRIAVVDIAYIFQNHAGIKSQVTAVENNLKSYDEELKVKRDELKSAAEKLKTFQPGSPEYSSQEEIVASMDSKLRLDMARKRKELQDAEARIYYENYQRIAAGVELLAQHNKINVVLRYNNEEMDMEKNDSVVRGVMKSIVYHDAALDMTQAVMAYLDRTLVATPGAPTKR